MPEDFSSIARARDDMREDHEQLHALLARLRVALDRATLAALLRELPSRLAEHFQREEQPGGLYEALGVRLPEARGQVGQLVDDHFRLVSIARDLAEEALSSSVATAALHERARRVADYLADHETREMRLIQAIVDEA